jgi:peptidyl-prolyl cis-trans isomerase B (cyclophilin B)
MTMFQTRTIVGLAVAGLIAGSAALYAQAAKQAPAKAPAKAAPAKASAAPAGPVLSFTFARGLGSNKQNLGVIEIEMFPDEAPKSVEHVLNLVKNKFYSGLRVHWSTPSLVQFGDPLSKDMTKKDMWGTGGSGKPVGVAEANLAKHKFDRGVVGLAYRQEYDAKTADSMIFIIKGSNSAANGKYAVLGKVTTGLATLDKLEVGDRIETVVLK